MRIFLFAVMLVFGVASATAQEKADPRAVVACQEEGGSFVSISECLPSAHVAFAVLDAFDRLYAGDAKLLRQGCEERNKKISGVSICVQSAIEAAIELSSRLPEGSSLNDPVFDAVRSPALYAQLVEAADLAKEAFPDQMIWGGGTYFPYQ